MLRTCPSHSWLNHPSSMFFPSSLLPHLRACSRFWSIGLSFLSFLIRDVGRTPWTGDQLVARNRKTHTHPQIPSMPWVGFECTVPASERAKTVHTPVHEASFLSPAIIWSVLVPSILWGTLFLNTHSLCSSFIVRDQVSHSYKTTGKITVSYILICVFRDSRREYKYSELSGSKHYPNLICSRFWKDLLAVLMLWLLLHCGNETTYRPT
jgi:hypothetical protein